VTTANTQNGRPIRVVALCGSLRPGSRTRRALHIALQGARNLGAETELIDLREYTLPFCDGNEDESAYPPDVFRLRRQVQEAHGIILGTPEYHGGPSGVLKNALDLMGFEEFQGKVVGLMGTAGGATGAINSLNTLRIIGRSLRAWVIPHQVSIARASKAFDDTGRLLDDDLHTRLLQLGREVARFSFLLASEHGMDFLRQWEQMVENPGAERT